MLSIEFGFLLVRFDVSVGDITIETLPSMAQDAAAARADEGSKNRWIHAPAAQSQDMFSGKVTTHPHRSRVFGLSKTHCITHATATDQEHADFIVWMLSFVKGIRLTTTEAGFLDATPIEPHTLTDGVFDTKSEGKALAIADSFWRANLADKRVAKGITGVIHCLYLARMPLSPA